MTHLQHNDVKRYFNRQTASFDAIYTRDKHPMHVWLDRWLRQDIFLRFEKVLRACKEIGGASILDIGCGPGRYATALAQKGFKVTGIDFSENMITAAESLAVSQGVADQCHFTCGEFLTANLEKSYDIVLAIGLFDYLDNPEVFLGKMQQLSRRAILATFPRKLTWRAPLRKMRLRLKGCPVYFYTGPQIAKLFAKNELMSLSIESLKKIYFVTATTG